MASGGSIAAAAVLAAAAIWVFALGRWRARRLTQQRDSGADDLMALADLTRPQWHTHSCGCGWDDGEPPRVMICPAHYGWDSEMTP